MHPRFTDTSLFMLQVLTVSEKHTYERSSKQGKITRSVLSSPSEPSDQPYNPQGFRGDCRPGCHERSEVGIGTDWVRTATPTYWSARFLMKMMVFTEPASSNATQHPGRTKYLFSWLRKTYHPPTKYTTSLPMQESQNKTRFSPTTQPDLRNPTSRRLT